jgi:hypothetical protein
MPQWSYEVSGRGSTEGAFQGPFRFIRRPFFCVPVLIGDEHAFDAQN